MAVKYKRPGHEDEKFEWELRGRSLKSTRRRLFLINLGLCGACLVLLLYYFMGQNATERWLPIDRGTGVVIEKIEETGTDGEAVYFLDVRVSVPPANDRDMSFLVGTPEEIEKKAGQVELNDIISTDPGSFQMISEDDPVLVDFQIDMQREHILIRRMFLMD
ncbi:MAG: hypothetical protein COA73_04870 [Candidatus Hydrogenedentota bacterium]|nr:MAG: hypothetical protein COA73_04870 [Candidatus Hydrogenedentota bacterium]